MNENLSTIIEFLKENLSSVVTLCAACGVAIDLTPFIKLQPIRWILVRIGRMLNVELYEKIGDMQKELRDMEKHQVENDVKTLRRNILNFATECRLGAKHDEEQFTQVFSDVAEYKKIVKENDIPNELINANVQYIREIYHKCKTENKFV